MSVNLPDCDTSAPDLCSTRSLGSKASTPQDGDKEGISGDSGNGETGDDETNISAVVGDNSAKRGGKSEYERTREANIARNKELFQELGDKFGWGDEENDSASEKKEKKKKDKKKGIQEPTRSSARIR